MPLPRKCVWFLLTFVSLASCGTARAADELAEKIEAIIKAPQYKHARWGILVLDLETEKPVYSRNPDMLFAPASVTKLYSSAAALAALGADHTFETPVYRRGEVVEGRLKGDLILVAKGDFTLGGRTDVAGKMAFKDQDHIYASATGLKTELTDTDPLAGLKALAKQVKEAGIRQVDGDVLIDDRLWVKARGSGSGPDILSPIVVNDNIVDVVVTPAAKVGDAATAQMQPRTDFVQIDVQVETVGEGKSTRITVERVAPSRFVVRGQIGLKVRPQVRICPVDDPAGFARALLIDALRQEGVTVRASGLRAPTADLPEKESYSKLPRVAVYKSPPLGRPLKVVLKVSHNLYASMLPLLLAVKHDKRTLAEGMAIQGQTLAKLGIDSERDFVGERRRWRQWRPCHSRGHGATSPDHGEATRLANLQGGAADSRRRRHPRRGGVGRQHCQGQSLRQDGDLHRCRLVEPALSDAREVGRGGHDFGERASFGVCDFRERSLAATRRGGVFSGETAWAYLRGDLSVCEIRHV